mgnify:CR=1 FL=1
MVRFSRLPWEAGSARGSENSIGPVVPRCTADLLQEGFVIVTDIVKAGAQGDLTDGKISFCQEAAALHDTIVHDVLERGLVHGFLEDPAEPSFAQSCDIGKLRKGNFFRKMFPDVRKYRRQPFSVMAFLAVSGTVWLCLLEQKLPEQVDPGLQKELSFGKNVIWAAFDFS